MIQFPFSSISISMARTLFSVLSFTLFSIFISFLITPTNGEKHPSLHKENLTQFDVYMHIIITGPDTNAVMPVAAPNNASSALFGMIIVMDCQLTKGSELGSMLVGRAQGHYASVSQTEVVLMMTMDFVFVEGKYNGSTISISGRNVIMAPVRELPILGGSGLFRFARGYVQITTHTYDRSSGYAILKCKVSIAHD